MIFCDNSDVVQRVVKFYILGYSDVGELEILGHSYVVKFDILGYSDLMWLNLIF